MNLEDRIQYAKIKARHLDELKPWYKKWWGILIIIITLLFITILTLSAIYVYNKVQEIRTAPAKQRQEDVKVIDKAINRPNAYYIGASKPVVTIVEFSDFACPFCEKENKILKDILKQYPTKVRLEFRDYPIHEQSIELALAARCAGEQNKFWPMHDKLFANQELLEKVNEDELPEKLTNLAATLNIDTEQFSKCLELQKYKSDIRQDYQDAEFLEVQGTPTWFINNYKITGYLNQSQFNKLITGLLQQYDGTN